jgi:outer membrane protein assembly factor BamB
LPIRVRIAQDVAVPGGPAGVGVDRSDRAGAPMSVPAAPAGVPETPVLIDLGVLRSGPDPDGGLPSSGRDRWWRRARRFGVRRWLAAAVVVALAGATLAGSGIPAGGPVEVFSAPIGRRGTFAVGDGLLYVLRVESDRAGLAAYGLGGGTPRWETPIELGAGPGEGTGLLNLGDVLAVTITGEQATDNRMLVFDAGTGRPLWTTAGYVLADLAAGPLAAGPLAAGPLILSRPLPCASDDCLSPDIIGLAQDIAAVNRRTGAELWRLRIDEHTGYSVSDLSSTAPPRWLAVIRRDGGIALRDLVTGRVTGTVPAPEPGPQPAGERRRFAAFAGERLLLLSEGSISAYDTATLRREWTVQVELRYGFRSCGAGLICVGAAQGTLALDAATGQTRWRLDGITVWAEFDGRHLIGYPTEGMVEPRNPNTVEPRKPNTEVLDAETGRRLFPLREWEPVGHLPGLSRGVVARVDDTRVRMWFGELRPEAGGVWPIGTAVRGVTGLCEATKSGPLLVACPGHDERVRVLRLPDPARG